VGRNNGESSSEVIRIIMAEKGKDPRQEESKEVLVRILGQDILGSRTVYAGITNIKGISWGISNAVCKKLGFEKSKRISELSKADVEEIEKAIKELEIPAFLKNRRNDFDSGENKHLIGNDLDVRRDFDIKRLKKIKSYKGQRHSLGLPVRGQRTRSNFRRGGKAVGVKRKKK